MQRTAGGRADDQLVADSVKVCLQTFTDLSHSLVENREGLGQEEINRIRDKIALISGDAVTARYMYGTTTATIDSVLAEYKTEDGQTAEDLKRNIKQRLEQTEQAFDAKKDPDYAQVVNILKAKGGGDMDEDIDLVVVDKGLTDADIICPYTQQPFKDPMKNPGGANHASCIHHVSREALESMCKSRAIANCPRAGCKGKWSKATAVLDEDFKRRIARYGRAKEAQGGPQAAAAHDVDAKDDYTQL